MTQFKRIKNMTIEEMAKFFAIDKYPNVPPSACFICEHDQGFYCRRGGCDDEHKIKMYQKWLESECEVKKCCKTCKYRSGTAGNICLHKEHPGYFVPEYTVCDDYEE